MGLISASGKENGVAMKRELGRIMNTYVGIFRQSEDITKAITLVQDLRQRIPSIGVQQKNSFLFNNELVDILELENMSLLAEAIATCALAREESRGSHFRRDFPKRDDETWGCHSAITRTEQGGFSMTTKPVTRIKHMPAVRTY